MRILIVEDERRTALDLQATVREVEPDAEFLPILDTVESAIEYFRSRPAADLAFFDIQLADGLSFDIFNEVDVSCPVVFCTAFDEYALQAFQVNSVDYILKPFDRDSVRRALEKVKKLENFFQKKEGRFERLANLLNTLRPSHTKNVFLVSQRDKLIPVSVADIAYFYIEHEVTFLYTFDGRRFIEQAILAAGSAPSGANQQPWTFVAIADAAVKARIRAAAEEEEKAFYDGRAGEEWLEALAPLGTGWEKPFLETAPWLVAVFMQRWGVGADGQRVKHYYALESVGIAIGFLIAALHEAGLATLTHTPSPMGFLNEICGRPDNEKPIVLLVVGKPAEGCRVPDITKKSLDEIARFI